MDFDQDSHQGRRNRTVAFSVLALVTVGVLLGLLVGGLGLAAIRTVDVGAEEPTGAETSQPSERAAEPSASAPAEKPSKRPGAGDSVLQATPTEVATYEQIDLSGRFPDLGAGVTLQVQRMEGDAWADFPVTATTQADGSFATYVQTGQVGVNKFRMLVTETGKSTPPARVTVG